MSTGLRVHINRIFTYFFFNFQEKDPAGSVKHQINLVWPNPQGARGRVVPVMASKGKGKRMRPRYDPELAQAMAKRRKKHVGLKDELEEVVSKTTDIAVSLVSS